MKFQFYRASMTFWVFFNSFVDLFIADFMNKMKNKALK